MDERSYDLTLFGATGFTGKLTAEYLARAAATRPLRWAIAGRDAAKLEKIAAELAVLGTPPAVVVAAVDDPAALRRMAAATRVLATTVGPYDRYGDAVVEACVLAGTHYCDITGEPAFVMRTLERWHAPAREAGLKIVSCCGFDSIPHDLGAWLTVRALPADQPITVEAFVRMEGKFSGGTWHSAINAFARPGKSLGMRVSAGDGRKVRGLQLRPHFEKKVGEWVAPMPTIDPWIVLRSAAALREYGPEFRYSHNVCTGSLWSLTKGLTAVGGILALSQFSLTRNWLLSLQPSGTGPSEGRRSRSHFEVLFFGRAANGATAHVVVSGGDPGYTETSKMLAESALALAFDGERLPAACGVLTPAVALGEPLVERLRCAGLKLDLVDLAQPPLTSVDLATTVWPNGTEWYALEDGLRLPAKNGFIRLQVVDCGLLKVPSGQLVACDPFADMYDADKSPYVSIPRGTYPVKVTLADVSGLEDGSHLLEAYMTLLISNEPEHRRSCLVPLRDGEAAPKLAEGNYVGVPVDAGTACFVDRRALGYGMPPWEDWLEKLFEHSGPDSWFNIMDDPGHIRAGLANIPLPLAKDGANILIAHSGWGDGLYPVVGGYGKNGKLVRVHIDFQVVGPSE